MQSKQVDQERLRTRLTKLPQTEPTPHASLDNIQLFSTQRLVTATLLIDLLINNRFLCLYGIKINFSRQINTHLSPFSRTMMYRWCNPLKASSYQCQSLLSLIKPPFLSALISCKHSCRFSPLRNTSYPMRKLTIDHNKTPALKKFSPQPLTRSDNIANFAFSPISCFTQLCMRYTRQVQKPQT